MEYSSSIMALSRRPSVLVTSGCAQQAVHLRDAEKFRERAAEFRSLDVCGRIFLDDSFRERETEKMPDGDEVARDACGYRVSCR